MCRYNAAIAADQTPQWQEEENKSGTTTRTEVRKQSGEPRWFSFSSSLDVNELLLRILYLATTLLSVFMLVWILIFPSSWLVGRWKWHDDFLNARLNETGLVPPESLTKYAGHGDVQILHTLAGAVWAGVIPFQLHPNFRNSHKKLHRLFGYAFFGTSLSISVGIVLMQVKKLTFVDDYRDLPPLKTWEDPVWVINLIMVWFIVTAGVALRKAMQRKFSQHQDYVLRHVGAGLWVAIQRLLLPVLNPQNRMEQREAFAKAAHYGAFITIMAAELGVYLLRQAADRKKMIMGLRKTS